MAVHSRVIMQRLLSYIQYIIDIWCYFSKPNIQGDKKKKFTGHTQVQVPTD